jgi:hypothetical protein
VVIASAISFSPIRDTMIPSSIRTSRSGCMTTIWPASLPRYRSKSASLSICTWITSAVIVPLVPGVQPPTTPMSGCTCGSIICAWKRSSDHPRPNGKCSRWGLASPHSVNVFIAQSLACLMPGPPVRRGP